MPDDVAHRRKKLLVADMESTIIEQECLDELADYVGLRPKIAAITERAMRGELDFEAAIKERVGLLKGLDARVLDQIYAQRVTLMPGAQTLVATMRENGAYCALVSGASASSRRRSRRAWVSTPSRPTAWTSPTAGSPARWASRSSAARPSSPPSSGLRDEHGLNPTETMAVGDGANDLAMIGAAGLGVAFRAKPMVAAAAAASITHGDLTALLYLQGYRRDELQSSRRTQPKSVAFT